MSLTPAWLDELRARTSLSALIGRTVKITKAGREFKGCCPFHNEKTPSFYVNDDKGFYHCLGGETQVITDRGRETIASLEGQKRLILSRDGKWLPATFTSYGVQELWTIALSRNGVKKMIRATSGHRWFVHDRVREFTTAELRRGHALQSVLPPRRSDWHLDPEGVRHGIVFGDGSMYKGVYGTLNLHGEKDAALRHWFPEQVHHVHTRDKGKLYLRVYGGRSFENMKQLPPKTADDRYVLGFLAGYFAADGHVAKDGTVMLNSSRADHLEAVRDMCTRLGLATFGRTTSSRKGFGTTETDLHRIHFVNSTLTPEFFLLPKARERFEKSERKFERLRWVVNSVVPSGKSETVYCAEVPDEHAFALDDHILTGNCFGCSAHGDAIRWMTDQRGLPFMDAVKELAQAAGMEVPAADPRAAERAERANSLYDVMTAGADWFTEQLSGIDGAEARAYLKSRGMTEATIKAFGLGFAPDGRTRLKSALSRFGDDMLVEAGLLISVEDKEPYDRFRGRLMIPIRDARGRVIAFGGRILGQGEPKYLNSPDTPLFDKGRTLYNLDRAGPASRKTGRAIVVEGYMDVIALAQAGIEDAVAPLGTALTEHQIERLWRLVEAPLLCFDGDAAGQKAANRAIGRALPALSPSHTLRFVTLPKGQDPDDVIRTSGRASMDALLNAAEPLAQRLWASEYAAAPLDSPEARAGLRQRLNEHVTRIADPNLRDQYKAEMASRFEEAFPRFPKRETWRPNQRPTNTKGQKRSFAPELPPSSNAKIIGGEGIAPTFAKAILAGLIRYPEMILACAEALGSLPIADDTLSGLRTVLLDAAYDEPGLDSTRLITICDSRGMAGVARELYGANGLAFSFTKSQAQPELARRDLGMAIEALAARPQLDAALAAATAALGENWDETGFAEQMRLLEARRLADERLSALAQGDQDD